MDVASITSAGYGGRVTFLDDTTLAYAVGHGVVLHETDSGLQVGLVKMGALKATVGFAW